MRCDRWHCGGTRPRKSCWANSRWAPPHARCSPVETRLEVPDQRLVLQGLVKRTQIAEARAAALTARADDDGRSIEQLRASDRQLRQASPSFVVHCSWNGGPMTYCKHAVLKDREWG